jgi:glycosyltransferase involved in cell wall biosynthesis
MKTVKEQTLVSILMPVYNAEKYLSETLESIRSQTYKNWELFAIDDWSTDRSYSILLDFAKKDKRIKLYRNGKHRGVAGAANLALSMIKSDYVARMDADDLMHPERIAKQVKFLKENPDVVIVGSQCVLIDQDGQKIGEKKFPMKNDDIMKMIFRSIPIQQPSMMINRALLPKDFIAYDKSKNTAEEVGLLFKLFEYGEAANLPDFLHFYRLHDKNTSLVDPKKTFYLTFLTRLKYANQASFTDLFMNFIQLIIVFILPKKLIYPLYNLWRNNKLLNLSVPSLTRLFKI